MQKTNKMPSKEEILAYILSRFLETEYWVADKWHPNHTAFGFLTLDGKIDITKEEFEMLGEANG